MCTPDHTPSPVTEPAPIALLAGLPLSSQQGALLRALFARTAAARDGVHDQAEQRRIFAAGVPFSGGGGTPTARVDRSRALARLERRGLLVRQRPTGRTVALRLTAPGIAVASALARGDAAALRAALTPPAPVSTPRAARKENGRQGEGWQPWMDWVLRQRHPLDPLVLVAVDVLCGGSVRAVARAHRIPRRTARRWCAAPDGVLQMFRGMLRGGGGVQAVPRGRPRQNRRWCSVRGIVDGVPGGRCPSSGCRFCVVPHPGTAASLAHHPLPRRLQSRGHHHGRLRSGSCAI